MKLVNAKGIGLQMTVDGNVVNLYPMVLVIDNRITGKNESLECYSDHFTLNGFSCTDEEAVAFIKRMAKHYEDEFVSIENAIDRLPDHDAQQVLRDNGYTGIWDDEGFTGRKL